MGVVEKIKKEGSHHRGSVCVCVYLLQMLNPRNVWIVHRRFALVMAELNENAEVML